MAVQRRVNKNGEVRWIARWRDKGGKEHSKTFDTRREAKAHEANMASKAMRGVDTAPQKMTVLQMYDAWLDSRPLRASSRDTYESTRDRQLVPLHNFPAVEVTVRDINQWRAQLENGRPWIGKKDRGLGAVSVRNAMLHLAAAYNWAIDEEILLRSPVQLPAAERALDMEDFPDAEEIRRVIDCVREGGAVYRMKGSDKKYHNIKQGPQPVVADMMEVVALTGLRASEIGGLIVADVDLERGVIRVRAQLNRNGTARVELKTARSRRVVPIAPELYPVLRPYVEGRDAAAWVFTSARGVPYSGNRLAGIVRYAARHCNTTRVHMHTLRHSFASGLLTAGVPVQDVAQVLGHTVQVLLETYTHVLDGHSDRVAEGIASGLSRGIIAGSPKLRVIEGGA